MRTFPITGRIKRFASVFRDNGYSLFVVGGAVRDFLLGLGNSDLDFTTDARPEEVIALFRTVIPTGIAHGTVTVIFEGEHYEVTTFRSEGEYKDGRRPSSVTFIPSLEEDLKRRDFTINAFAASAITGKIIDNHNGEQDLKDGTIRAIGNPYERFDEDALRIMRAARISGKLNFTIEDQTFNAMGALKENLRLVSVERLHDELVHLVKSDHPRKGFEYLHASGALAVILPELAQGSGV
ncbi:MAG TPA: polynucleotide adenylyltransferase, partial [Sphaerochaeta sp.]|nr:polynucleotide adenylyltransferase [Sphaerochaeta sp.]